MVSLIIGHRGSGKTKLLIDKVNDAAANSTGNVICIEKETKLTFDVTSRARLVAADNYSVMGFDAFYGFLSGICAGDHDITDVFVDATFKIGGRDYEALADFLKKVDELSKFTSISFTFTISTELENLPERMFLYCKRIN